MFQETEFVPMVLVLIIAKLWRHTSNQNSLHWLNPHWPHLRTNFSQQVKTWAEFSSLDVVVFFYAHTFVFTTKTAKLKVENLGKTTLSLHSIIFVKS